MTTPDWVARPYPPVHNDPSRNYQWTGLSQDELRGLSERLNESMLQNVALAVNGAFVPTGSPTAGFDQIVDWANGLANLDDIEAATSATQAYVADINDMATVPRVLVSTTTIENSTTKPKFKDILAIEDTLGWMHHGVTPTIVPVVGTGTATGSIYYTPIVVDRAGIIEKIRWIVGSDTSAFSIDYYEMALCALNPATMNIEKIWGSGDIKDAEASIIGSIPAEVPMTMTIGGLPINQQCTPGQILFIAHQQTAPGVLQTPRRFAAVPTPPIARTVPILDAWCYIAPYHAQGIPSSIPFSSLTRENRYVPWASVSVRGLNDAVTPTIDPAIPSGSYAVPMITAAVETVSQPAARSRAVTFDESYDPHPDDVIVLFGTSSAATAITTPSGWENALGHNTAVSSTQHTLSCLTHKVTQAEASARTRTYTASNLFNSSIDGASFAIALRGVDPASAVDAVAVSFSSTAVTPHVIPGLFGGSLSTGARVMACVTPDGAGTYTPPAGWSTVTEQSGTAGRAGWVGLMDAAAESYTSLAATNITPSGSDEYASIAIAFNPLILARPYDSGLSETFDMAAEKTGVTRNVVTDHGGVINNSAVDSRTAINAAINACSAGDEVYLPNGTYYLKGTGSGGGIVMKSGVKLRGESEAGVILASMFTGDSHSAIYVPTGSDVIIEKLTIQKNSGAGNYAAGIRFHDANYTATSSSMTRAIVRNVTITDHEAVAIAGNNTKHLLVEDCTISDALALGGLGSGYGILFDGPMAHNNWARNNVIGPVIRHGIMCVDLAHHNLIEYNEVVGNVAGAIDMHGEYEYSNEIRYNIVHDVVRDGTTVSPNPAGIEIGEPPSGDTAVGGSGHDRSGTFNWVHHNDIYNCVQGVRVQNTSPWTIVEDNTIHNCDDGILVDTPPGYAITEVQDLVVKRNDIRDCINGIRIFDGVDAVVTNNVIEDNTEFGLWTDAQTTGVFTPNTYSGNGTDTSLLTAGGPANYDFIGAASANATSITIPAGHQLSDLIIMASANGSGVTPGLATGWTSLYSDATLRIAYKVATHSQEVSGTWSNADSLSTMVIRSASGSAAWAATTSAATATSATITYPDLANSTPSWLIRIVGHRTATDLGASPPAGWTLATAGLRTQIIDTRAAVSVNANAVGGNTQVVNNSGGYRAVTIRLYTS